MNIRKNIDYSEMYAELDTAMSVWMPQVDLYYAIGNAVCRRTESGAAVAASEYLCRQYPDVHGLSPRNLRRMREFYRIYKNDPRLLSLALQLGWTQNVVIMEAGLSTEQREWYLKAASQFVWSKAELIKMIANNAHEMIVLTIGEDICYNETLKETVDQKKAISFQLKENTSLHLIRKVSCPVEAMKKVRRRWSIMLSSTFTEKRIVFMRC